MTDDRNDRIRERAYEMWQREGGAHGSDERHWHQAAMEIDRESALPLTADDALPQTGEIAASDVQSVEALAMRTGISGDEAQEMVDKLGSDRVATEQAARGLKSRRRS
ncbi:DUF2934 domain-containing protein [Mesorhizobium sp. ES1-1]|uniref:DUF2934 domain-containing protein n=1 Tax=Mesorhizobium sp. ES1-1 TaxID=2876629 RepID=UPI001CCC99FB|nr:DUF2934 domain-containing protein [Mesorhizobium sp. ES1-1]MBZ9678686.1 DUF2934 domain-containing protein [Mesorhizobium sp. ES1-1]